MKLALPARDLREELGVCWGVSEAPAVAVDILDAIWRAAAEAEERYGFSWEGTDPFRLSTRRNSLHQTISQSAALACYMVIHRHGRPSSRSTATCSTSRRTASLAAWRGAAPRVAA